MSRSRLFLGDCLDALRQLPEASVDAVVTDPPYGLSFMGKRWDYDVPSVEVWAECLRVLKPGGHLLAFASTRTQHRMAVRIEDAGFEIRDMIAWVYSTGFPKSLDVSKAIDKAAGAEREVLGYTANARPNRVGKETKLSGAQTIGGEITAPATDAARQWQGWGTALKPALEPITVARKPLFSASVNVLNAVESQLRDRGVAGDIRWKLDDANGAERKKIRTSLSLIGQPQAAETSAGSAGENATQNGGQRIPINSSRLGKNGTPLIQGGGESLVDSTKDDCETACSPPTAGGASAAENPNLIFSQSTTSMAGEHNTESGFTGKYTPSFDVTDSQPDTESFAGIATGLTGSMETVRISRDSEGFFLWPNWLPKVVRGSSLTVAETVLAHGTGALNIDGCRVGDEVTVTVRNGNSGANGRYGKDERVFSRENPPGRWPANLIHDGSEEVTGLLGEAARFFYTPKADGTDRNEGTEARNIHPTVKPTDLMQYLCRLVTPPGGTVLDPFMGSGSTGKAAQMEGFRFIGCERDPDYFAIAKARVETAHGSLFATIADVEVNAA